MKKNNVYILENRGLLYVSGEDCKEFLQNIVTNNINNVDEKNSYELNNVLQGSISGINNKIEKLPIKVINLKRRKDRRLHMESILKDIVFDFKDAVDGNELKENDPRLYTFKDNDFNNNVTWNTGVDGEKAVTTKINPHSEITWTKVKEEMDKL